MFPRVRLYYTPNANPAVASLTTSDFQHTRAALEFIIGRAIMAYVYAHIIPVRYAGNATIPKTNR